jgi:hypothetical protein
MTLPVLSVTWMQVIVVNYMMLRSGTFASVPLSYPPWPGLQSRLPSLTE